MQERAPLLSIHGNKTGPNEKILLEGTCSVLFIVADTIKHEYYDEYFIVTYNLFLNVHTISSSESQREDFDDEVNGVPSSDNSRKSGSHQSQRKTGTFLMPGDIHPNMEHKEDDIAQLRLLAGKLSADWRGSEFMAPALARRIRDFQFAQEKRRKKYGDERPWGILGLYDHLSSIRIDVDWAEDAAWRRANGEPYQSWADFDESRKGRSNRPIFTYFALTVCTIVMIASISMNGWKVEAISDNPMSKYRSSFYCGYGSIHGNSNVHL